MLGGGADSFGVVGGGLAGVLGSQLPGRVQQAAAEVLKLAQSGGGHGCGGPQSSGGARAAAAAILVVGMFIALRPNAGTPTPTPPPAESAVAMMQVAPSPFTATVSVNSQPGGTAIDMSCTYGEWPAGANHEEDQDAGDKLAMVVVGRDGSQDQVATWVALDGTTATPRGQTSMPVGQIAAVRVVSADTGQVYLQRNL
jgi:hypothetical protein